MRKFEVVNNNHRKTSCDVILPKRATSNAMAYDFYSPIEIVIQPNSNEMIWTDVKVCMNKDEGLILNVRSSMGKYNVMLSNTQGWIDSDYYNNENNDGNIGIMLHNLSDTPYVIKCGDRIAQGMFVKYLITDDDETDEIRKGGFGSTNK